MDKLIMLESIDFNNITKNEFKFLLFLSSKDNKAKNFLFNNVSKINFDFLDLDDDNTMREFVLGLFNEFTEKDIALFFNNDYENIMLLFKVKEFATKEQFQKLKENILNEKILDNIKKSDFKTEQILHDLSMNLKKEEAFLDEEIVEFYQDFEKVYSKLGNLLIDRAYFLADKYPFTGFTQEVPFYKIENFIKIKDLNCLKTFYSFYSIFVYNKGRFYYYRDIPFLFDSAHENKTFTPSFFNLCRFLSEKKIQSETEILLFENIINDNSKLYNLYDFKNLNTIKEIKRNISITKEDLNRSKESFNILLNEIDNDLYDPDIELENLACDVYCFDTIFLDNIFLLRSSLKKETYGRFYDSVLCNPYFLTIVFHSILKINYTEDKYNSYEGRITDKIDTFLHFLKHSIEKENNSAGYEQVLEYYPEMSFLIDLINHTCIQTTKNFLFSLIDTGVNLRTFVSDYQTINNQKSFFDYLILNLLPLIQEKCKFKKNKIIFREVEYDFNLDFFKSFYKKALNVELNLYSNKEKLTYVFYNSSFFSSCDFKNEIFKYYLELNKEYNVKIKSLFFNYNNILTKDSEEFYIYKKIRGKYFFQEDVLVLDYDLDHNNYLYYRILSFQDFNNISKITGWNKYDFFKKIKNIDYLEYDKNGFLTNDFYDILKLNFNR
tara:strand:+ start:10608 stop:12599 length:1992 start_codon:yes stop_codon:yes gene_type:complete